MVDAAAYAQLSHSKKLSEVDLSAMDCMFIAGGHGVCVDGAEMKASIETLYNGGKLVAADCHGPYALIGCTKADGTPLVSGLRVTGFTNVEEDQAGASDNSVDNSASPSHPRRFPVNSRTYMGCADPLRRGADAPHQCPLGSVASHLCHFMLTCIANSDDSS